MGNSGACILARQIEASLFLDGLLRAVLYVCNLLGTVVIYSTA